jgi:hypothetical protein
MKNKMAFVIFFVFSYYAFLPRAEAQIETSFEAGVLVGRGILFMTGVNW